MEILVDNEGLSHIGLDIFTYLDPSSLAQARLVCKSWCLLITRSRVWWTSKLSQFKRKTKRIEGENGVWVLMPRNHERWNYWKKPIKHFMKKANLDYLEKFTLFLINEVPFVEDKTAGNVAQLRDQLAYETESLTKIDKLFESDPELAKEILKSFYKVPDYTKPLILAVQEGLHNLVLLFAPELIRSGIDLNKPLPNIGVLTINEPLWEWDMPTYCPNVENMDDGYDGSKRRYNLPIILILGRFCKRDQILEMLKYFLDLGLDINAKDTTAYGFRGKVTFLNDFLKMQKLAFFEYIGESGEMYYGSKKLEPKSDTEANIEDELFNFLLSQEKLDINFDGFGSYLSQAIDYDCRDEWIQALIQRKGITIDPQTIHQACQKVRLNVVKMLLNMDPNLIQCRKRHQINNTMMNGGTLLHSVLYARLSNYDKELTPIEEQQFEELLEFLLSRIDVNIPDDNGATPLHFYCQYIASRLSNDSGRMLQLLLKQPNINVNASMTYKKNFLIGLNNPGQPVGLMTPLHICCDIITKSSSRCAKLLLERHDIDLNAINEAGQTPLDVAKAGEKVRMKEHEKFNTTYLSPGCNFDLVYLIEEKEFINNFNNLADLFAQ